MATKDTNYLVAVHKGLDESLEKQVAALPEKFNKQRFLQNCMTVLQDGQADFSKCEAPTVVRTLLKGAFLGLDFFNGECYAIPYGNQCQFQTDYKPWNEGGLGFKEIIDWINEHGNLNIRY